MRKSFTTKEFRDLRKIQQPIFVEESIVKSDDSSQQHVSHVSGSQKPESNSGNTLACLTRRFVNLMKQAPGMTIEIQEASQRLGIQKRRIYDITNVLEGIGYIQKLGKNLMKWVGGIQGSELERNVCELQAQITIKIQETKRIEEQIDKLKSILIQDSKLNDIYNYLQPSDVMQVMQALEVNRLLIYTGSFGDHIECDSNPDDGVSTFIIESVNTETSIYYCSVAGNSSPVPYEVYQVRESKQLNDSSPLSNSSNSNESVKQASNSSQEQFSSK